MCDEIFALIHCDIWGPFKVPSSQGHRYFVTIVDDHSRYTWIYLLKQKYEVQQVIPRFYQLVLT